MASVNSVTRQIAALEISSKPNTSGTSNPARPTGHQKKSSHDVNKIKLLNKLAAPNAFAPTKTTTKQQQSRPASPTKPQPKAKPAPLSIDIGKYDGGFENDEKMGGPVFGEAAKDLALDSSTAGYVANTISACSSCLMVDHL